jgi:hypothetical protein
MGVPAFVISPGSVLAPCSATTESLAQLAAERMPATRPSSLARASTFTTTTRAIADNPELSCHGCGGSVRLSDRVYEPLLSDVENAF